MTATLGGNINAASAHDAGLRIADAGCLPTPGVQLCPGDTLRVNEATSRKH